LILQFSPYDQLTQSLATIAIKILFFIAILAVTWLAGRLLGTLAGRLTARGGGDSVLRQTVVGRSLLKSGYTSSSLTGLLTRWITYLVGFLFALESLSVPFITDSVSAFLSYLPNLIGGIIILLVGIILSDWMGELAKRSFSPEISQLLYMNLVGDGVKVILYFVTITIALKQLGVDVTILYIVAQALAWGIALSVGVAAGIAVGWALKDRIKNWIPK
jgi:small-conductance mechanosensitive channel